MRLLIDTHIWLWSMSPFKTVPEKLTPALHDPRNQLFLSAASVWEATIKYAAGKLKLDDTPWRTAELMLETGAHFLPISLEHAGSILPDPPNTADPFDRILLAQCQVEGMRLITMDRHMAGHRLAWQA